MAFRCWRGAYHHEAARNNGSGRCSLEQGCELWRLGICHGSVCTGAEKGAFAFNRKGQFDVCWPTGIGSSVIASSCRSLMASIYRPRLRGLGHLESYFYHDNPCLQDCPFLVSENFQLPTSSGERTKSTGMASPRNGFYDL